MSVRIDGNLLLEILEETPATQNIMLMGKHGIGKSQILEKFYTAKGCKVVSLFLGQMSDPGDLIGIPHKNEETGHLCRPTGFRQTTLRLFCFLMN